MKLDKVEYCDLHKRGRCIYQQPRNCPYAYAMMNIGDCDATVNEYCSFQESIVQQERLLKVVELEQKIAYWDREIEKANYGGDSLKYWSFRVQRQKLQEELDRLMEDPPIIPYMVD